MTQHNTYEVILTRDGTTDEIAITLWEPNWERVLEVLAVEYKGYSVKSHRIK